MAQAGAGVRLGVVFPSYEIGTDAAVIKDWVQAAEQLGYSHIVLYDHVLGVDPARPGGWAGRYARHHAFHEPMVLMGFMAACTSRIEFTTGILILPQRQTVLVAKQAAEVAVLAPGRLRLGVAIGWNEVEYEALGMNFHDLSRREEEQIALLRELWEHETVNFDGEWHRVQWSGINPRPSHRVPIWLGGNHRRTVRRAVRHCDGWFQPMFRPGTPEGREARALLDYELRAAGRDAASFGIEGWLNYDSSNPERWQSEVDSWVNWGASHLSVRMFDCGLESPAAHIQALRAYIERVGAPGL